MGIWLMDIITRAEAKAKGLKRYFTGKPCKHGHVEERMLANGNCIICDARLAALSRRLHAEAIREVKRAAYKEQRNEIIKDQREYRLQNAELINQRGRARRAADPDKFRERDRRKRAKQKCVKAIALVDRGLQSATILGSILDHQTAIDLFKCHDNAFEFDA